MKEAETYIFEFSGGVAVVINGSWGHFSVVMLLGDVSHVGLSDFVSFSLREPELRLGLFYR
jgi:hypothetical protein